MSKSEKLLHSNATHIQLFRMKEKKKRHFRSKKQRNKCDTYTNEKLLICYSTQIFSKAFKISR